MSDASAAINEAAIVERLGLVRERIAAAEVAAGRPAGSARLIAVSKRHPAEALRAAYAAGQRDFGENYVQELLAKREALADLPGLRLHLIGNLQSNKAKQVAARVALVHTVDDEHLARELGRRAAAAEARQAVLVQVNVAGEAQKHGCAPAELEAVLAAVEAEAGLWLRGLMVIPPLSDDAEAARPFFAGLRALRNLHGGPARLPELSMGMSHDLEAAVAEGATMVRVGTAIFGERA
ncbi:MAG: YggS family pyridoxal phosphate-dependent enzyme [Polyangiaceae bacterium]|jgi:PLP dependent protein|nr:YggS family pyridoxal phosphate-dependent enzyme [Polyangiaceae bacterium]